MSKARAKDLLNQNTILGAFLSDPKEGTSPESTQPKPVKRRVKQQEVSRKPSSKPKTRPSVKKTKPVPVFEDKKRVTYYVYRSQASTLLRLIFELDTERGVAADKSQLVRAAINILANQELDTIVKQLKNA